MTTTVLSFQGRRAARLARPAEAYDRTIRLRIGLIWGLVFLNVLTFYKGTWNGLPLIIPIPSKIGEAVTQGSLPVALLLAWSVNRRMLIRPNVFLSLLTLLFIEAFVSAANVNEHLLGTHLSGTLYRTVRLGEFIAVLWLLTPFWDRRDLLLVRCQLKALGVVLASILLGLMVSPHRALAGGRLSGEFWPITPVQVADYSAVALGLVVVLWFCGEMSGRRALPVSAVLGIMLLLTHTRVEVIALVAGLVVAGLSMFAVRVRVRRLFAGVAITVSVAAIAFSGVLTAWLARGENTQQLSNLTGRTNVWTSVLRIARDPWQMMFGYSLSSKAFNGLPIDSNWLAGYYDLGLVGVAIIAAFLLFVLVDAFFQPRGVRRALALFLVTYLIITSYTETGLSDASMYLLELYLAASLLVPPAPEGAWYAGAAGP
jgi:O-Antigen ligase